MCKIKRRKLNEGEDMVEYSKPESHEIVDEFWVCEECYERD